MEVVGGRASVTALELFFDLVFVFALTQVTALMARESPVTVTAVTRGTLILTVLWWCWVCYAWLFNVIRADEGVARAAMFGAMGGMFIAAITIPEAFDDLPSGLPGPTVFAACYFVVRAMHILMFWLASRDDPTLRGQMMRFVPTMLAGTLLLLIAAQTTGTTQMLLWLAALAGDYGGTLVTGALWWAYFDITSRITERRTGMLTRRTNGVSSGTASGASPPDLPDHHTGRRPARACGRNRPCRAC